MHNLLKKKILYAPLFTSLLSLNINTAQSQETTIDLRTKIIGLENKISGLDDLKKELEELKKNLEVKEKNITVKEEVLDNKIKSISSLRKAPTMKEAEPSSRWHLAGYADVGFEAVSGDAKDTFVAGKFNPAFHFQFKDWVMFESELEITTTDDGETEIAVEYSQLNFLLHDNMTLVVGKFLSPIGQFQERLHPSWINKVASGPAGFMHGGAQPSSDVGFMLRGGVPVDDYTFTYSLAVGNGPRLGHDEDELELEGFGKDNDSNKSFGGRLALVHKSSLEVGFSYLNAGLNAEEGINEDGDMEPAKNADYRLWGADIAYAKGPWDIRAEYLNSKSTPVAAKVMNFEEIVEGEEGHGGLEAATWETWYAQMAYRLSGVSDNATLGKFEPVIRYGEFRVKVDDSLVSSSEKRWNVGLNFWAAPTVVVKAGVERRNYMLVSRMDETRYQLQMSYGF
ncbi:porin [Paremcibacter congregatus]|uniref:porin n=1 Tax=Paremcibacter congregatus TaxID=2043170 RepID=UPI0030ED08A7|tara:strand:- start:9146 stop:10504 length:1359 start_codon:yes stop_codon:yes gene_type:complete